MKKNNIATRRDFIRSAAFISTGTLGLSLIPGASATTSTRADERMNIIGPRDGFSPQIGTLLSMMTWMRHVILMPVQGMSVEQLDFLVDENSNSIGAMLLHLAATERFYQVHTFERKEWGDWSKEDIDRFEIASNLGDEARKTIKGNNLDYYLSALEEVRANTIKEFKKRDDKWLMAIDEEFPWGPTNNYCKWFHVCEHESNHNGQFKYIKARLPGSKLSRG